MSRPPVPRDYFLHKMVEEEETNKHRWSYSLCIAVDDSARNWKRTIEQISPSRSEKAILKHLGFHSGPGESVCLQVLSKKKKKKVNVLVLFVEYLYLLWGWLRTQGYDSFIGLKFHQVYHHCCTIPVTSCDPSQSLPTLHCMTGLSPTNRHDNKVTHSNSPKVSI